MASTEEIKYFAVQVKLQTETDQEDKAGNPKIKKSTEEWIVRADTSEEANKIVKEEYEGCTSEWYISSVKATKYLGVLNYSNN